MHSFFYRKNSISTIYCVFNNAKLKDSIALYIYLAGTNNFHYLNSCELLLSYDSLAFGTLLAKSGKIHLFDTNYHIVKDILNSYEFTLTDHTPNTIKCSWRRKDTAENYLEISPLNPKNYKIRVNFPILQLKIPVADISQPMNLNLSFADKPIAQDPATNKTYEIDYQYTSKPIKNTLRDFQKPIIDDFYPKEASVGDTIVVKGKYFAEVTPMLRGRSYYGRGFAKSIDKKFILSHSDTEIVFIVPPFMQDRAHEENVSYDSAAYLPVTGCIFLSKPKVYNGGSCTNEELVIKRMLKLPE